MKWIIIWETEHEVGSAVCDTARIAENFLDSQRDWKHIKVFKGVEKVAAPETVVTNWKIRE